MGVPCSPAKPHAVKQNLSRMAMDDADDDEEDDEDDDGGENADHDYEDDEEDAAMMMKTLAMKTVMAMVMMK